WMSGLPLLAVLMGTRALAGFLFSATPPAAQAYIVDRTSDQERTKAVALLGAAAGIGSVLGPGLIWGLSQFESVSLATPLYVAAALPIIPTIALGIFLPKEKAVKRTEAPPVLWAWDKRIAPVLLVGLILNVAIALLLFTLGFYFQDRLHLNEYETTRSSSMAMLIVGVVAVVVQVGVLRVLTWSPVTLLRVGMSIMAVGTGLLVFSGTELTIDVSVAIIGMGYAFAYPGFQAAISFAVGSEEQGAVAGLAAATGAVAFIIGPVVGTLIYQWEPTAPYMVSACVLLAGAVLAMVHPRLKAIRKVSKGVVTVDGAEGDVSRHVSSESFSEVLLSVEQAILPADRFALLVELSERHHFTSEQIREFMVLFTFGKDRVEVAAMLHGGVHDPENFYIVYKALTFDSEKASLQELVGGEWPKG
ncbi:MAG: DHA1 family tetracycline resistance protein-like MFS transporter, partial [Kiritimatiellia bacterium]